MTVRHWSRVQRFAGRQKTPQRHQLDYTIHWPELRSVEFTAAPNDNSFLLAGDASSASFSEGELAAEPPGLSATSPQEAVR